MRDRPSLAKYKKTLTTPLKQATLCFLVKGDTVLLAMKKRGFAEGKWNGAGGKMDERDKDIKATAVRETIEEIGVIPKSLKLLAVLSFYHLGEKGPGQQVTVYLSDSWEGEPVETEEMAPKWFKFSEIPYEQMWWDDKLWLPQVLRGTKIKAEFLFDENQNLLEQNIIEEK